jgi:hypothetical protein
MGAADLPVAVDELQDVHLTVGKSFLQGIAQLVAGMGILLI